MEKIVVWTKQHVNVLNELQVKGRYIAKKEYIVKELQEHTDLVLEVYDWYVRRASDFHSKPVDVEYPIWVSLSQEATMLQSKNTVIMTIELEPELIMPVNIDKWGMILNYSYIPCSNEDAKKHKQLLNEYGTTDTQAYMSQFYPIIKREIITSWERLFDDSIIINNEEKYGTIWELKREWVVNVIQ